MFECELRSSDIRSTLTLILCPYHPPALPRHIFKTTYQHIVEQYRSHISLKERLHRGAVDLVRYLSLGTVSQWSERQPPEIDIERRPRRRSMGSIRPYTKPLITRVDTTLKPIDPSGRPYAVITPRLTELPAQAPILPSSVPSKPSADRQVNTAGDYPEATPGDHLEVQLQTPPNPLTTVPTRALEFSLPDGTPEPTTHTSANASSVGFGQTETLRQRKPLPIPLTKTFSEQPHSQLFHPFICSRAGRLIYLPGQRRGASNFPRAPEIDERFSARNPNVGIGRLYSEHLKLLELLLQGLEVSLAHSNFFNEVSRGPFLAPSNISREP